MTIKRLGFVEQVLNTLNCFNKFSFSPFTYKINALEYESTIPNKYMVGTEAGVVFICNKRFKTPADRIYAKIQCCHGTVSAVQRNPSFLKFFLSVGDWQAKIWCEELKDSPIFWTKEYVSELIYGCWNSVRCSSFYLCRMDGWLDAWDVINRSDRPVLTTKVTFINQTCWLKLTPFFFNSSPTMLCSLVHPIILANGLRVDLQMETFT